MRMMVRTGFKKQNRAQQEGLGDVSSDTVRACSIHFFCLPSSSGISVNKGTWAWRKTTKTKVDMVQ